MTETPGMPTMLNLEWEERIVPERFAGQTVIVTGAGAGIGLATTSRILREGGRVVAVDLNTDGLDDLSSEFSESLVPVQADLTDPDAIPGILSAADNRVDA
ncbi:SDR family NAD(P)-dependent oxidoreductase [Kocuria atrinae]|uniref:SDR family NAD(P)-dependent oxidoreductase n=1 Tax=Kocuria atrinae TaxID=592377 RepID=UPI0021D44386|nr:SDR family NAD(P)-dependent oxidoreductase [Kocuria atrinae]